ncbi:hypothetical protein N7540_005197 [Penicillium herquei]|nr:hypothetical protein N7540_005197 [Penicillium herquei]
MATESFTRFNQVITKAANYRSGFYNKSFALSAHWELDANSDRDVAFFKQILQTFRFPPPINLTLATSDPNPALTLHNNVTRILETAKQANGRTIVILHYTGHGSFTPTGGLWGYETPSGRRFNLEHYFLRPAFQPFCSLSKTDQVDILYILDCPYKQITARLLADDPFIRTVEVLAATDDDTLSAFAPPRNTLTGKIMHEIVRRKLAAYPFVEFANIIETPSALPKVVKKPIHRLQMGISSICLP